MTNIGELSYQEMLELICELKFRVREYRPIRIRKKWKRCGKAGCFCKDGPADGSWDNLHGPYVSAQFVSNENGRMRVVSLGKYQSAGQLIEAQEQILDDWWNYFSLTDTEAEEMREREGVWLESIQLSEVRFREFYGMEIHEDRMSRCMTYYATEQKYQAYEAVTQERDEARAALSDDLATGYGIGSVAGQKKLRQLLRGKYFLAD